MSRRTRLDKDFPVIKPKDSRWGILDVLQDCNPAEVRRAARSSGFKGETDILLAEPLPSPSSPQKNEALGLFYIGESARRYGFNVEYWDARHENEKNFWERVARANAVGFTAITGFQLKGFVRLAEAIKKHYPGKPVILGGPHATLTKPEVNLADPLVDFVVFGEGELRLPAILRALYRGEGLEEVDGIGHNWFGKTVVQPSRHVPDPEQGHLVRAVSPYTLPYFAAAAARNEMILPTSRGCPWSTDSCDFCSVGKQYLDSYREFPFELWQADIMAVHQVVPVKHIEPEDENSAKAILPHKPFLPFLKSIGATSHLHLRSDQLLEAPRVRWLAEMGVKRIHVGVESGNERVLNQVMHKNERVEDHFVAAKNMAAAGIEMVATYIVANPTETWSEIEDTLDLAEELSKAFPKGKYRATIYVLAALPGTPIYYTIERMHLFNNLLEHAAQELEEKGELGEETEKELGRWYRPPLTPVQSRQGDLSRLHPKLKELYSFSDAAHPKVADTAQEALAQFLVGAGTFKRLRLETEKWLWPTPKSLREWVHASAAYNPFLPEDWNAIYPIAGLHFNKYHKTAQNFPGWKRLLISPFELLADFRYRTRYFKHTGAEIRLMSLLINWASERSVGTDLGKEHSRKVFELYSETLAGH